MSGRRLFFSARFFLALIIFPIHVLSDTSSWWIEYDTCAWPSLDAAVPSSCASETFPLATKCLCESSSFLSAAAKGIGSQCGCSVLSQSAATAARICGTYQYHIALTESQIVAAGQPCSDSTASSTAASSDSSPTSNSTPAPSSTAGASANGGGNSGGLSPGVTAAITVISLVVTILTLLLGCLEFRRRRKNKAGTKAVNDPLIANTENTVQVGMYPTQWNPVGARYYP